MVVTSIPCLPEYEDNKEMLDDDDEVTELEAIYMDEKDDFERNCLDEISHRRQKPRILHEAVHF